MREGEGGEKCDNDESQCVPESQEAAASFFPPLVQKQCQSRTVMASCLSVTGGGVGGGERKLNEWN